MDRAGTGASSRRYWLLTALCGLATLMVAMPMIDAFPGPGDTALDLGNALGPVMAFEFADSQADLIAIFGSADDPLRAQRIAAMDTGHYWDFLFLIAYSAFMACLFVAAAYMTKNRLWLVGSVIALLSGVSDGAENLTLLGITKDLEAEHPFGLLAILVWTKFLSIAVCGLATALFLFTRRPIAFKLVAVSVALGSLTLLPAFFSPEAYGALIGNGVTAYWAPLLIVSALLVWRPHWAEGSS